ncbi:MAG TPA: type III pantothenate kinase [Pyrinomonadaceae bacterium]|jgi:type III pantothenate kinase
MLLTIDIGNSSTKIGAFERETLVQRLAIPTIRGRTPEEIYASVREELKGPFTAVVVASVVPELNDAFRQFGERYFKRTPLFVDNRLDFGLAIKYFPPENLGIDRLVAAFAATRRYGAPAIVCDFGTATTIDAVNSRNEYLGGVIAPGMNTLSEALFIKTSKLPRVEIRRPASVIGDTTVGSIQSGIFYGYVGLTEGIMKKMTAELGEKPKIVATGGFARLLAENCDSIETVDENLMLDGLRLIHEKSFAAEKK